MKEKRTPVSDAGAEKALAESVDRERTIISDDPLIARLARQGWIGIAVWMSFGLLLEGLIAFRIPDYLNDPVRRELFRLAHAHGTLLSVLVLAAGLCLRSGIIEPARSGLFAMMIGAVLMPIGFLLGGVVTYESDPNALVSLAPVGGILLIFGIITVALSIRPRRQ